MKKWFNLLLGLLFMATFNATAGETYYHYQPRLDLFQDAFKFDDDSLSGVGVVEGKVPLSKYFIYTEPGKFVEGVTDYEAWVPEETKLIFLGITHEKIEGVPNASDHHMVPLYKVTGSDNTKETVKGPYRWYGDTTLGKWGNEENVEKTDSTQYYVLNFIQGAELTGSITITIPDGHIGYKPNGNNETTYKLTLKRSDDINKISGLKSLAVFEDSGDESLLKDFDKLKSDYEVESAEGKSFTVKFEPVLAKSTIEAYVDGVKKTAMIKRENALQTITVPMTGGLVELIVTAPNGVSKSTYTIKIVQKLLIPTTNLKSEGRDSIAELYIKRLYLTDGEKEYDLYSPHEVIGKFNGRLYHDEDSNRYVASVPDPSASNLELGFEFFFDKEYRYALEKQRFFVDKTTGQSVFWTVSLKKPKEDVSNPDPEIETHWEAVQLAHVKFMLRALDIVLLKF